jgi:hypothetical protein
MRTLDLPRHVLEDEDPWLKQITLQVLHEGRDPQEAIEEVTEKGGHLAIGTAVSSKRHRPMPALRAITSVEKPYWTNRLPEGTPAILRASSIAGTAIHAAFGGDINILQQRAVTNNLLVPEAEFYQGGTYGWEFDPDAGAYVLIVHERYMDDTATIDNGTHIGNIDFVRRDHFDIQIPDEPGHFGSEQVHDRVGSIPITMGQARMNMGRHAIRYIGYRPLGIPLS